MKQRIISGILVTAVAAALVLLGGNIFRFALLAVACLSEFEIFRVAGQEKNMLSVPVYLITALVFIFDVPETARLLLSIAVILFMSLCVIFYPRIDIKGKRIFLIALFYVAVLSSDLYIIRNRGLFYCILAFATSWGSDTTAYFAGCTFGKKHPFPLLSPKKSVAGCIGGVLGGGLLGCICALVFRKPVLSTAAVGIVCSAMSEIGDLAASMIKRQYNAKDYGDFIKGHGGFMDRIDSLLFTGAIIYICIVLFHF